jgi:serine/threonine protein phosphatase 1
LTRFAAVRDDDDLVTLGDYVNRGPNACAVLDWLIARANHGKLIAIRGNHDLMMLSARDGDEALRTFIENGGDQTLASYSHLPEAGRLDDVPDHHWRFLEQTWPYHETASHFFVHANAYADLPLNEQPDYMLYWESFGDQPPHISGKVMVCGHTPQPSRRPCSIGHAVCIDTGVYERDGWLTCLDIASGRYWQANEQGETQDGWLDA